MKTIYMHNRKIFPTKSKNEKVYIIGDSHLKQINKSQFRKELGKTFTYFKCFSDANTKQLNYYIVATLAVTSL